MVANQMHFMKFQSGSSNHELCMKPRHRKFEDKIFWTPFTISFSRLQVVLFLLIVWLCSLDSLPIVQNNQESRREYWATHLSVHSLTRTAHLHRSLICSLRNALLRSSIRSLTHSIPSSWENVVLDASKGHNFVTTSTAVTLKCFFSIHYHLRCRRRRRLCFQFHHFPLFGQRPQRGRCPIEQGRFCPSRPVRPVRPASQASRASN